MTAQPDFPLALDHLVVFVSPRAPERETLHTLGLLGFGGDTAHGTLGTASTAFFFDNTYLELMWAADEAAALHNFTEVGLDFVARLDWKQTGASPFSIALRHTHLAELPFPTAHMRGDDMPLGALIRVNAVEPFEPACIVVPEGEGLQYSYPTFKHKIPPIEHPLGVRAVSAVRIVAATDELRSPAVRLVSQHGIAMVETGAEPLLELTFDGGRQGKTADARPTLPIVFQY